MPWQGPNSRATHDIAKPCQVECRLLIRKHVWEIRVLSTPKFFSEVVMLYVNSSDSVSDLSWRQEICTQLARAWDKPIARGRLALPHGESLPSVGSPSSFQPQTLISVRKSFFVQICLIAWSSS